RRRPRQGHALPQILANAAGTALRNSGKLGGGGGGGRHPGSYTTRTRGGNSDGSGRVTCCIPERRSSAKRGRRANAAMPASVTPAHPVSSMRSSDAIVPSSSGVRSVILV